MPAVIQALSDVDYANKVASPSLASLVRVWKAHLKGEFDLTIAQKHHFIRLAACLKLGAPIERLLKPRKVEVAVAT